MKVLITSALPYINGIKHLGNLVGSMLPADVCARYNRQIGNDVLFICATDEHGTPAELAAQEEKMQVADYCNKLHETQADIYKRFDLSFDEFGRSSHHNNHELTQHFAERLQANGYIEERTIKQLYSIDDERFLPDRYVQGTCPHCNYEKARGDQCESCTRVLDPTDLIAPYSTISGSKNLEIRETKHLFLKQSALADKVKAWVDTHKNWPEVVTGIARKWLNDGLQDRCITRDLKWGIPVNRPGFEDKVFYVWFDAPIAYIATTKTWADKDAEHRNWRDWWTESNDIKYYQFMGKDNVPFHSISFPATIIGSGEPWKMVDQLKGLSWLNYYGGKFSTSQKRGIFTGAALEEFPSDYWRYWLMANIPEGSDTSFTFESFGAQINKDLNGVLGNFVNRTQIFCAKNFGNKVPVGGSYGDMENCLIKDLDRMALDYTTNMDELEFRKAMISLRTIWTRANVYFDTAAPWIAVKNDKDRAAAIIRMSLNLCNLFAKLSWPIIPNTSEKIMDGFGTKTLAPMWPKQIRAELNVLAEGMEFQPIEQLFQRIQPERLQELSIKYKAPVVNDNNGAATDRPKKKQHSPPPSTLG